ncbi:MAG: GNAT family N-acetyltransferase, partial [Thermoplasmata archaeon]
VEGGMTIPIRIRRLQLSDYDAMIELFRVCGLGPRLKGRDRLAAIAGQLRSKRNVYLGAFDGDRLVGAVLGTHDTRKGWINRLAVHPDYRRAGIARRLVRKAERELRRQGLQMFAALIEPGNTASEAVFRALGYEILLIQYARRKVHRGV